jgi:hypothetical protein
MWKKFVIVLAVVAVLLLALLTILSIDGRAYERWKSAQVLRTLHLGWIKDGTPFPPPNPTNYGWASWGTSYVYNVSHNINGTNYQGLFAFDDYHRPHHYAIATNGVIIVREEKDGLRLLRMSKDKAAAW